MTSDNDTGVKVVEYRVPDPVRLHLRRAIEDLAAWWREKREPDDNDLDVPALETAFSAAIAGAIDRALGGDDA